MRFKLYILSVLFALVTIQVNANDIEVVNSVTENRTLDTATDLHIKDSDSPLSANIDITCEDAFLFFDNVRPETVLKEFGDRITISGQKMNPQLNCRLSVYKHGSVITMRGTDFQPLTTYTSDNFEGESDKYSVGYYYSNGAAEEVDSGLCVKLNHDNGIRSFILKRGYMATFATQSDGLGYSRCFVADKEDIKISQLPIELLEKVSFIRVFQWNDVTKKGWVGSIDKSQTGCKYVVEQTDKVNGTWYYNWSPTTDWTANPDVSEPNYNMEFVPEKWGYGGESDWKAIMNNTTSSHLNGYNEPDHTEQSNVTVERAIEEWPKMLQSGMRLGSPATTDNSWLFDFVNGCKKKNYRVDYVNIHAYWGGLTGSDWYKELKKVHDATGLPIWITEWNNGANWTKESWPSGTSAQQEHQLNAIKEILTVLDTCSFVERYSIYNWVEDKRALILDGELTPAGEYYASDTSTIAYNADMQVIPEWNVREGAILSYTYSEPDRSIILSWTDPNGEQIKGFTVERVINNETQEVYRTDNSYVSSYKESLITDEDVDYVRYQVWNVGENGKTKKMSNTVEYSVINNDTKFPSLFKCIVFNEWKLHAMCYDYGEKPLTLFGVTTNRIKTAMTSRAKNITSSSFMYSLKNWDYQGTQTYNYPDTVSGVFLPKGTYESSSMKIVADSINDITTEWKHVSFESPFLTAPVVVASSQTANNEEAFVVGINNVTAEGFDVALRFEEGRDSSKVIYPETIIYIAANEGICEWNGYTVESGIAENVGAERYSECTLNLNGDYSELPYFFGSFQNCTDNYASTPRIKKRTPNSLVLFREREISNSTDTANPETLGYIVFGQNNIIDSTNDIHIGLEGNKYSIFSLSGTKVMSGNKFKSNVMKQLNPGVYLVKEGISTQKMIVR